MALVPCSNPKVCGVKQHVSGSAGQIECAKKSQASEKMSARIAEAKRKSAAALGSPPPASSRARARGNSVDDAKLDKLTDYKTSNYNAYFESSDGEPDPKALEPAFKFGDIVMRARENKEDTRTETLKTYRDGSKLNMIVRRNGIARYGYEATPVLESKDGTQVGFTDGGRKQQLNSRTESYLSPSIGGSGFADDEDSETPARNTRNPAKLNDDRLDFLSDEKMRDVEKYSSVWNFEAESSNPKKVSLSTPRYKGAMMKNPSDGKMHSFDASFDLSR